MGGNGKFQRGWIMVLDERLKKMSQKQKYDIEYRINLLVKDRAISIGRFQALLNFFRDNFPKARELSKELNESTQTHYECPQRINQ